MNKSEQNNEIVDTAVSRSLHVAPSWANASVETRCQLLEALAAELDANKEALIKLADQETHLGEARLGNELDRTSFQLRGFAAHLKGERPLLPRTEPAVDAPPPVGRPRLALARVALGPVAMFSASNFPFAFSVLGGDTASALAAGCPVVVKAHRGHPELSREVYRLAVQAIRRIGLPEDLLQLVEGNGNDVGVALIRHAGIAAAAFTGSTQGGIALWREANARPVPIPFYGELGSINPVVILPGAIEGNEDNAGRSLASSIEFGCGQICTSPGVIVLFKSKSSDQFVDSLCNAFQTLKTHPMLTEGMKHNFDIGVARLKKAPNVRALLPSSSEGSENILPQPFIGETTAAAFIEDEMLREEVFGPACLIVRVTDVSEALAVLNAVGGSLTVTVWGAEEPTEVSRSIVQQASRIGGRVIFGGVPTGVAVSLCQQHGGPWPSSTNPATTSVGYAAIDRFLRPVALQNAPGWVMRDFALGLDQ